MAEHGAGAGSASQLLSWSAAVLALGMLTAVIALVGPAFVPGPHPGAPQSASASASPGGRG